MNMYLSILITTSYVCIYSRTRHSLPEQTMQSFETRLHTKRREILQLTLQYAQKAPYDSIGIYKRPETTKQGHAKKIHHLIRHQRTGSSEIKCRTTHTAVFAVVSISTNITFHICISHSKILLSINNSD